MSKRKPKTRKRQAPPAQNPQPAVEPVYVSRTTGLCRRDALAAVVAGRIIANVEQDGSWTFEEVAAQALAAADAIIDQSGGE